MTKQSVDNPKDNKHTLVLPTVKANERGKPPMLDQGPDGLRVFG